MKRYVVYKLNEKPKGNFSGFQEKAEINNYPWNREYCPKAEAALAVYDDMFVLHMQAQEKREYLRCEEQGFSSIVHQDSCMEFFFLPDEEDGRYINFEINPAGAAHIAVGKDRYDRSRITEAKANEFTVTPFISGDNNVIWGFTAFISFSLIARLLGSESYTPKGIIPANFYICGDKTGAEHYGVWNDVWNPVPDFHRPEFFGLLEIRE